MNSYRENKRTLTIATENGSQKRISVYSVTTDLLDSRSKSMIDVIRHFDYFFPLTNIPKTNFAPIISSSESNYTAGVKITPDSDENFHMYVTGTSGSGKTYFLLQQALFRAQTDDKVIIFDNGGYFEIERLRKIFKDETDNIVKTYISHHFITDSGIPIDLFSLENCKGTASSLIYSEAIRLYNILTASSNNLGDKQSSILIEELKETIPKIKKKVSSGISDESLTKDICDIIGEMIKSNKMNEIGIGDRLANIINIIKGRRMIRQSWKTFLDKQKKIVVIETDKEKSNLGSKLIDLMLASLYAHKTYNKESKYTVIIDEISSLNLSNTSTINNIAREGRQKNLSLLFASQDFMKEKLNSLFGNLATVVYFKPTDEKLVASHIKSPNIDSDILKTLHKGECIVDGNLFSKSSNNNHVTLKGKTADFIGSLYYSIIVSETFADVLIGEDSTLNAADHKTIKIKQLKRLKRDRSHLTNTESDLKNNNDQDNVESGVKQKSSVTKSYDLNVSVLVEDTTNCDSNGENGFSLLIEYDDKMILFDAGRTDLFAINAEKMLIDLSKVDFGVLSHGHRNHSDGFETFLKINSTAKVFARNDVFEDYYRGNQHTQKIYLNNYEITHKTWEYDFSVPNPPTDIGINKELRKKLDRFTLLNQSKKVDKHIFLVGHDNLNLQKFGKSSYLFKYKSDFSFSDIGNCPFIPDDFKHEHCLVLDTSKGLVIFSGCSHAGIINTIYDVKRFCVDKPIYAYIGGFHMKGTKNEYGFSTEICNFSDDEIVNLCNFIKKENIKHIYTGHCTGDIGFQKLQEQLGDIVHRLTTGMVFEL